MRPRHLPFSDNDVEVAPDLKVQEMFTVGALALTFRVPLPAKLPWNERRKSASSARASVAAVRQPARTSSSIDFIGGLPPASKTKSCEYDDSNACADRRFRLRRDCFLTPLFNAAGAGPVECID